MYKVDVQTTYKSCSKENTAHQYRCEYLKVFGLSKWDNNKVDLALEALYEIVKDNSDMIEILNHAKKSKLCDHVIFLINDNSYTIFSHLFQYDTFHDFHACICDIICSGYVDAEHFINLTKYFQ